MADIVGIGKAVHDLMMIVDSYPVEDAKQSALEAKQQSGGPCGVALIAASKLGVSSKYLGKVGADFSGQIVCSNLEKYGVDISDVKVVDGISTRVCVVISNRTNHLRTCLAAGGTGEECMYRPDEVPAEALKGAKFLHLDGFYYDAALLAAKKAHEMGIKISMDAEGADLGEKSELLELVDVLVPSEDGAYYLTGTKDPEEAARIIYDRYHPELLVITTGPEGGVMMADGKLSRYSAYTVDAIDTNGAGDVFHGALDAALVLGFEPEKAVHFAAACSAIKCTHFGASEGAPAYDTVIEFLRAHGEDF